MYWSACVCRTVKGLARQNLFVSVKLLMAGELVKHLNYQPRFDQLLLEGWMGQCGLKIVHNNK